MLGHLVFQPIVVLDVHHEALVMLCGLIVHELREVIGHVLGDADADENLIFLERFEAAFLSSLTLTFCRSVFMHICTAVRFER